MRSNPSPSPEVRRIYDDVGDERGKDEFRVLVDRLWPRGVKKEAAALDLWAKDAAPSADLRRWYGHDPDLFDEFARRYREELACAPGVAVVDALARSSRERHVVFLTATKDVEHSGAVVLADVVADAM